MRLLTSRAVLVVAKELTCMGMKMETQVLEKSYWIYTEVNIKSRNVCTIWLSEPPPKDSSFAQPYCAFKVYHAIAR